MYTQTDSHADTSEIQCTLTEHRQAHKLAKACPPDVALVPHEIMVLRNRGSIEYSHTVVWYHGSPLAGLLSAQQDRQTDTRSRHLYTIPGHDEEHTTKASGKTITSVSHYHWKRLRKKKNWG